MIWGWISIKLSLIGELKGFKVDPADSSRFKWTVAAGGAKATLKGDSELPSSQLQTALGLLTW
jgi:hypothetical protein